MAFHACATTVAALGVALVLGASAACAAEKDDVAPSPQFIADPSRADPRLAALLHAQALGG